MVKQVESINNNTQIQEYLIRKIKGNHATSHKVCVFTQFGGETKRKFRRKSRIRNTFGNSADATGQTSMMLRRDKESCSFRNLDFSIYLRERHSLAALAIEALSPRKYTFGRAALVTFRSYSPSGRTNHIHFVWLRSSWSVLQCLCSRSYTVFSS